MTNDECRMTNAEQMRDSTRGGTPSGVPYLLLVIRLFVIDSSFDIRHSSLAFGGHS